MLLALLSLLQPRAAAAADALPAFSNYVVDEAGVVPDDVEHRLDTALGDYQKRSGNQVAVAVVRTTGGRPIEEYSLALANAWGVGQQGKDNGVVVVIAYLDHHVRIEVGKGLRAVLTNERAAGIVNDGLVQRLGQGDVGGAAAFATEAIRRSLGDPQLAAVAPGAAGGPPVSSVQTSPAAQTLPAGQPAPYQPPSDVLRPGGDDSGGDSGGGFPGWIFLAIPVIAVIAVGASLGRSRNQGYRSAGPMFWGQNPGDSPGRGRRSSFDPPGPFGTPGLFGSSIGSSGSMGSDGGGGGSFDGGGGGGFDGGGASGSW